MHKLTRKAALAAINTAGIENDQQAFVRLYTENRVGMAAASAAFREGRKIAAHYAAKRERDDAIAIMASEPDNGDRFW